MSSGGHQASRYVCLKKKLKHHKAVMPTQRRNEGGQGGHNSRGANLRWGAELLQGRRITAGGAEKSQQCHKYFLQYSKIAFERTQT